VVQPDVGEQGGLDAEKQRQVNSREVPERRNTDRTRPEVPDRTLAASGQLARSVRTLNGRQDRTRMSVSGQDVSNVRSIGNGWDFVPNGYFLIGAIYTPSNQPNE